MTATDARHPRRVLVWLQTFNHAPYVEQAMQGILEQETPHHIELVIHDDASSDDTVERIERMLARRPEVAVHRIYQPENTYSTGARPLDFLPNDLSYDYFALCEGDDFWTDASKLDRQVQQLEQYPNVNLAIHPAVIVRSDTLPNGRDTTGDFGNHPRTVTFADVLRRRGGPIPTAGLMLRRSALTSALEFCRPRQYLGIRDVYLQIFGAAAGGAAYLPTPMSAYRVGDPSSWSARTASGAAARKHCTSRLRALGELYSVLERRHHAALQVEQRAWATSLALSANGRRQRLADTLRHAGLLGVKRTALLSATMVVPSAVMEQLMARSST